MKKLILILFLLPLVSLAQTAALNFVHKDGEIVSGMRVMTLPTSLFYPGTPQEQVLIWTPPNYAARKDSFHLIVFHPGDGENNTLDISQVTVNSLAKFLARGMQAYSLVGKDTIWYVVAITHNNAGSAYRSQQAQTIPWLLYNSGLRVKPKIVVTGLSGGGSATYASLMTSPALTSLVAVAAPMANGGYDNFWTVASYRTAFDSALHQFGVQFWEYIGDQDPGYNSFLATNRTDLKKYSLPGNYHEHIIPGGTHSANTWDVPFTSRTFFDSVGLLFHDQTILPPPITSTPHAMISVDSAVINYPNSVVHLSGSASFAINGKITANDFYLDSGDARVILSLSDSGGICASGLRPGSYRFKLVATDSVGNKDSAYVGVKLNGPVILVCPVCPPPVVSPPAHVIFRITTADGKTILLFSDGTTQP